MLKIESGLVSGLYESVPSFETRLFSYRLDQIKNLTIRLFADGRSDKMRPSLQPKNNEAQ